jgi:hypothetical protein
VGELLVLAQPGATEADAAWAGLLAAKQRIFQEEQRRRNEQNLAANALSTRVQAWIDAIQQLTDAAAREQALREVEQALRAGDADSQLVACRALTACGQIEFDKSPFRPLLLPLASNARGALRVAALYALRNTVSLPEDSALALALADDPSNEARLSGPHLLSMFCERQLAGEADAVLVRMFTGTDYGQRRQMLSGLWGTYIGSGIENYLLELSRSTSRNDQYDAMYYALSTLPSKSEAVVRRLIEFLPSTDSNVYGRALWGLSYGIEPAQGPLVLQAARDLFDARSDVGIQTSCLDLIGQHAGPELEPWLASLAADTRRPEDVRAAAAAALEAVGAR